MPQRRQRRRHSHCESPFCQTIITCRRKRQAEEHKEKEEAAQGLKERKRREQGVERERDRNGICRWLRKGASSLSAASAAVGKQALSVAVVVVVAVIPGAGAAPAGAVQVLVTWPLYRWHVIC